MYHPPKLSERPLLPKRKLFNKCCVRQKEEPKEAGAGRGKGGTSIILGSDTGPA